MFYQGYFIPVTLLITLLSLKAESLSAAQLQHGGVYFVPAQYTGGGNHGRRSQAGVAQCVLRALEVTLAYTTDLLPRHAAE